MRRNSVLVLAIVLSSAVSLRGQNADLQEANQLLLEAQKQLAAKNLDEAVAILKKVVKLVPKNDGVLASLSDLERQTGKYADGIEHALQAIKINDKVPMYDLLVAINAYSDHDLDRAREYCEKVTKRDPKEVTAAVQKDAQTIMELLTKQTYTITWVLDPAKGRFTGKTLVIAIPKTDLPYQQAVIEVTGALSHRTVKAEANDVMQIVPKGKQTIEVKTTVTVLPHAYKKEIAAAVPKPLPAEARVYLGASDVIDPKSPGLVKTAAGLKGTNDIETARNVLEWMRKNIRYRLQKAAIGELDFKTMDEIIDRGHAECRGYTMLYTALCRAAGVAARPVWGLCKLPATESKPKGDFASHNWCEVYISGCGWIPVDPQKPESLGLQPTAHLHFYMDEKKTKKLEETLPLINLLVMNGDKIKFE